MSREDRERRQAELRAKRFPPCYRCELPASKCGKDRGRQRYRCRACGHHFTIDSRKLDLTSRKVNKLTEQFARGIPECDWNFYGMRPDIYAVYRRDRNPVNAVTHWSMRHSQAKLTRAQKAS